MSVREYAKVGPKAWQGATFKALRKKGAKALLVGLYLMTSPSSNMLGLYSQPILYMAYETGLGEEGALEGLRDCIEAGFCSYDTETEMVWVHEMARYQIADELKATDLRCKGIQKDYDGLPDNPFLGPFFDRYAGAFHLTRRRSNEVRKQEVEQAPTQAPLEPLRSQEQEQEQEIPPATRVPPAGAGKASKDLSVQDLVAEGVDAKVAADWLRIRKAKKAPLTQTAWDGVKREAATAGMSPAEAVKLACESNWQGFKAKWLTGDRQPHAHANGTGMAWEGAL